MGADAVVEGTGADVVVVVVFWVGAALRAFEMKFCSLERDCSASWVLAVGLRVGRAKSLEPETSGSSDDSGASESSDSDSSKSNR
jgi:hypothetical protein